MTRPARTTPTRMPAVTSTITSRATHTTARPTTKSSDPSHRPRLGRWVPTGRSSGSGAWTTSTSMTATADPRVEIGVRDVDQGVQQHVDDGDHQHRALDDGEVLGEHAVVDDE